MTVREALERAAARLRDAGVPTPWLDAWVLLGHILEVDRAHLLASYPDEIDGSHVRELSRRIDARLSGRPVSYLVGVKEFYGLSFAVDDRVLVPRPDTEALVDEVLRVLDAKPWMRRVHDCCTGSGCIAVTLAHERPYLRVSASDVSESALDVARINSRRILGREIELARSDLLSGVDGRFDVITANPPYLTSVEYSAMEAAGWPEPALALDGGENGLSAYSRLIPQAVDYLCKGGYLFVEAADNQIEAVCTLYSEFGYHDVGRGRDLAGRLRVCWGRRD